MRRLFCILALSMAASSCDGCDEDALDTSHLDAGAPPGGLSPEQARQVVARVGDRTITLGDYAAALERMNQMDRLRYQTDERRRELLDEIIAVELLAGEARRQGLHEKPEVRAAVRQILRDAVLQQAYQELPNPARIPDAEVKAYYEKHQERFTEPERRRAMAIVMKDREAAQGVLQELKADGSRWGELFTAHAITEARDPEGPDDMAGDLGLVGPPGDSKSANSAVPAPVREALFELDEVGEVHDEPVEAGGKVYLVRLGGISEGRVQALESAEPRIRQALFKKRKKEIEKKVEKELRKRFSVEIDESALEAVEVPEAATTYEPGWERPPDSGPSDGGDE